MVIEILRIVNMCLALIFFACYAYQMVYIPIPHVIPPKVHAPAKRNQYAVLICARNEEVVICDLIDSIHRQTYDPSLITVFVAADNCTDNTAQVARAAGAVVYERFNKELVGKGYALDMLLGKIREDYPEGFDGYFVFDADNILRPDYIEKMNREFSDGYDIVTSYRNSKNYGTNWISAGYALWFLRESRYLNNSRKLLNTSCAVSGTGFLFSRKVLEEQGNWPYYLLTEDIEFTIDHVTKGYKIGMAPDAMLYDEQPTTFTQSWRQRLRWGRGYLQVFGNYGVRLFGGIGRSFSCFDMSMTIMPAIFVTFLSIISNLVFTIVGVAHGESAGGALVSLLEMAGMMYLTLYVIGAITTATEWKVIHTSTLRKIAYTFTFPIFMFTYIPISVAALFANKVGWKPIAHAVTADSMPREMIES